jgi:choice-of-anchor B domain-containing protein
MKVYNNYAFIVGDNHPGQGMQVFDLTQLEEADEADFPITFSADTVYDGIPYGHNLWINEATGYAYIFRGPADDACQGATHIVNIQDPLNPTFAGCLNSGTDDSDGECVIYDGPDADYTGREICVVGSDEWVMIGDVTDKENTVVISTLAYPNVRRAHQGAFSADKNYWLISDTMDEQMLGHNTRTLLMDVQDLDNPVYVGFFEHATTARDHNVYVIGNHAYETNWRAGFRVIDMGSDLTDFANWQEIAYFDTFPENDAVTVKSGSWSHYDYFDSGVFAISDVESGLFMLQVELGPTDVAITGFGGAATTTPLLLLVSGAALAALAGVWLWRRPDAIHA